MPRRLIVFDDFGPDLGGGGSRINFDGVTTRTPPRGMDGAEWDRSAAPPFTASGGVAATSLSLDTGKGRVNVWSTNGNSGQFAIEPHVMGRTPLAQEASAWMACPSYGASVGGYGSQFITCYMLMHRVPGAAGNPFSPFGYTFTWRFNPNDDSIDQVQIRSLDAAGTVGRILVPSTDPNLAWHTDATTVTIRKFTLRILPDASLGPDGMEITGLIDDAVIVQVSDNVWPELGKMDVGAQASSAPLDTDKAVWLYQYAAYDLGPLAAAG